MQTLDIEQEIRQFIIENFLYGQGESLQSNESLMGQGVLNSTGVLELVLFLQERFEITVDDQEVTAENFDSIAKLVVYVQSKLTQ